MELNCICIICGRKYIYKSSERNGHSKLKCNSCKVNQRRFNKKFRLINYKGGKCELCGYDKNIRVLSFHHKNKKEKHFNISGAHCRSLEELYKELDTCYLLCANCHLEMHLSQNLII